MLDWPLQTQTSPTTTSLRVSLFLPLTVITAEIRAGLHGVELDAPGSIFVGGRRLGLAREGDGHILPGFRRAIDRHRNVSLEDHMVVEDRIQRYVRTGGHRGKEECRQD